MDASERVDAAIGVRFYKSKMTDIRKCPIPFPDAPRGQCRWCGQPITDENGILQKRRRWHPGCVDVYLLHASREVQVAALLKRAVHCESCKRPIPQYKPVGVRWTVESEANPNSVSGYASDTTLTSYTEIVRCFMGHVDHKVPLWKVQNVPLPDRLWYYGPQNLQILCVPCHEIKTSSEAGERAHFKRLSKKRMGAPKMVGSETPKPVFARKMMRSKGFDRVWKRKLNGLVVRRSDER